MNSKSPPVLSITSSDRLGFTIFIALMLHAIVVLGISFKQSDSANDRSLPSLDIILAQTKSLDTPEEFDFLAQENQQGGGEGKEKARPGASVSANTPIDQQGFAAKAQQAKQQNTAEQLDKNLLAQQQADKKISSADQQKKSTPNKQQKVTQTHLRIAQLKAEIKKMQLDYAKRPKKLILTASTKKAVEASYLSQWVKRIERIGNLNYPQNALQKRINGALRLHVTIDALGNVLKVNIAKTSGSSILDAAAKRIVKLSEPFQPFSNELKKNADQIIIIRTWEFSSSTKQIKTSG